MSMKLIHSLNTPNHFNKPTYNNYYSGYSSNYQPDNHKCRKSFRDTNARNPLAYQLEKLKFTYGDREFETEIKNNNLRPTGASFNDCIQNPNVPDDICSIEDFFKCFDKECVPMPGAEIHDNFGMERDGCRQRQVNKPFMLRENLCKPKNPECYPYLIEVYPEPIELPPIYGEWFPVPPEKDPNCAVCPDTTEQMNSQLEQAIRNANFGGNCQGGITTYSFVITGPAYKGAQYIGENGEPLNNEKGIFGEVPVAQADCKQACKMKSFCGSGGFGYIGGVAFGHAAIDYYYQVLDFQQSLSDNTVTTTIVMGVQLCFVSSNVETITITDWFTGHSTTVKYHPIYNVDAIFKVVDVAFMGSFTGSVPRFDSGSCLQSFAVAKICYGSGDDYRYTSREPSGGGPDQKPEKRKPKEDEPECMEACTCEQIEQLLKKYLAPTVKGSITLELCGKSQQAVSWEGEGFEGLNQAILKVGSGLQEVVNAGLCPEVNGTYQVPICSDGKSGFKDYSYSGKGLEGLANQLKSLGEANKAAYLEFCDNQTDIKIGIEKIPERVQIQLSDDIALIVSKLNQILDKIGKEDSLFERIIQIITLIATLLGLLNDIRSLLDKQKDYTPDLELLKELAQEIKRLLSGNLQGSIDAIRCDGTISSNSWGGEGLEGLNQAITAIGVNTAILHSDLCELLEKKTDQIKPPRLQGSVDAIRCDGTIKSNSWDGEGFEGLNQAVTAIGVNLAILHADLCGMLNEKDTFQVNEKYKCGDTEIVVQENIDSIIAKELKFLYDHLKRIELLICELEECNAVPVFPGDSIEERNIPAQAVITFVEQKYYPKMSGSKWHVSIPYPKEDLISEQNCWSKFENLIIKKGNVHGTVVWKSPNNTINRFYAGLFGHDENGLREFLERIAGFSRLQKATIRITTGGNPRARPKDVTIQAVKVVVLERDDQGRMVPVKCCRAPKSERYLG